MSMVLMLLMTHEQERHEQERHEQERHEHQAITT